MTNKMELYLNPCLIASTALDDLQAKLLGGDAIIDANNIPMFLIENSSSTIANAMLSVKDCIDSFHKARIDSTEDAYMHMSDYDYIGLFATPAPFRLTLELEKDYLIAHAKDYSDLYKQIIIPANSQFIFGEYTFGIYYPIIIKINKHSGSTIIEYDLSEHNPLYDLSQNSVDFIEVEEDNIKLIQMTIPVYQFNKTVYEESVTKSTGFIKTYAHDDYFYAVRAFHQIDGVWVALNISLSETIYNIDNPTVRFIVDSDTRTVKVIISPIYFTTDQITPRIKIELYTTKGELDVEINSVDASAITSIFSTKEADPYSTVLTKLDTLIIYPGQSIISGGSNGITFTELKKKIVDNAFNTGVIVSTTDIEKYFSNIGFTSSKYACNITDMIYLCHKQMTNSKDEVIAAGNIRTILDNTKIPEYGTMIENTDDSITILPSTIYKYDATANICVPLTDTERSALSIKSNEAKIIDYNSNTYTKSPFHVRLDRNTRYPMAYTYDLNQPTVKYLKTIGENNNADVILKVYDIGILHDGVSGYDIRFLVSHSGEFEYDDVMLFMYTESVGLTKVWATSTFVNEFEDKWIFQVHLDTNYNIYRDNSIFMTNIQNDVGQQGYQVNLESTVKFVILLKSSLMASESLNPNIGHSVPSQFDEYTAVIEQQASVTFGTYLSGIYNNVDVVYTEARYAEYDHIEYITAPTDISDVVMIGDTPTYVKKYSIGDRILDQSGNPIIAHNIGDVILTSGQPTVINERELDYYVDMIHIDAKLDLVTNSSYTNIMTYSRSKLLSYMNTISDANNNLLEGTKLFFIPIRTLGSTKSSIGNNNVIQHDLEFTIKFKLYVYDYVMKDDNIKNNIYTTIVGIIETYVKDTNDPIIASDVIVEKIRSVISEYIINVEICGFFGDRSIQTLISTTTDTKPHLKQYLVLDDDGTINIARGLTLEYATL